MNITIFTDTFYPSINGIVTSIFTYCEWLANRWHKILIIAPYRFSLKWYRHNNIEIHYLKGLPAVFYPDFKITFGFTPNLLKKLYRFKPDIVHFHTQFVIWWQAIQIWKLFSVPIVWTFHTFITDKNYLKIIGLDKYRVAWKISWKYNNYFYNRCDLIICPSFCAKNELLNNNIKQKNIVVLPNPIPPLTKVRKRNFFNDNRPRILYVWRLSDEKQIDVLINATYVVSKEISDIQLVIVWDWPLKLDLMKLVVELWIQNNVKFLWFVPHDELQSSDIYEKSSLFVTASPSETQWITILEAMRWGLPIVWVDAFWVAELVDWNWMLARVWNYGEIALYIIKILREKNLREKMKQKWLENLEFFEPEILIDKMEKTFLNLIR